MASNISWDTKDFDIKSTSLIQKMKDLARKGVGMVADEVLRLSQYEVPHDTGRLQNTGHVEPLQDEAIVGYNTVYAARLHEHPEYHFQKGRKAKYLEDPIKRNLHVFRSFIEKTVQEGLK